MPFDDYDLFADAYAARTRDNAVNAGYERPAIRALLPPVAGLRVLDAGCAAGEHALWLCDAGARVTAIDVSARMVEIATSRLGTRAQVVHTDLDGPLPFADRHFEVVFSSLALHYVADIDATMRELARVTSTAGTVVLSTHHPMAAGAGDYYATHLVEECWTGFGDDAVRVRWFHRSFEAISRSLEGAGLRIDAIREPLPDPCLAHRDPAAYAMLRRAPPFIFIRGIKD